MKIRNTALVSIFLGIVGCQDKPTPKPEPTSAAATASTPAPTASASATPVVPAKPWRTTPKELFAVLEKKCEDGAAQACGEAVTLHIESGGSLVSPDLGKTPKDIGRVAEKGCTLKNDLACNYGVARPDDAKVHGSPGWHKWSLERCLAGGDALCLGLRRRADMYHASASTAACDKGLGAECLVIAEAGVREAKYEDQLKFARRACDAYIQTCLPALEVIARGNPEGYASADARPLLERIAAEQPKRCAEGHPTCGQAALAYLELGKDIAEVRKYAEAGIEDQDQVANYVLGRLAEDGKGEPADAAKAAKLYEKCPDLTRQHEGICQARLAAMYEEGRGVAKDPAEALKRARAALRIESVRRATPTVLRLVRLFAAQNPAPAKDKVLELAKQECDGEKDPQCKVLWKLVEEGKPVPEGLGSEK